MSVFAGGFSVHVLWVCVCVCMWCVCVVCVVCVYVVCVTVTEL